MSLSKLQKELIHMPIDILIIIESYIPHKLQTNYYTYEILSNSKTFASGTLMPICCLQPIYQWKETQFPVTFRPKKCYIFTTNPW
jgi:hypothetical protein